MLQPPSLSTRRSKSRCGCWVTSRASLGTQSFEEGHLQHLLVRDRPVSEVAVLAEQLAVVRGHDQPRVTRHDVVQLLEETVEIGHRTHLPGPQLVHLTGVEEAFRLR